MKELVRNKIPGKLLKLGLKPETHIASDEEYSKELINKLKEEVDEFCDVQCDEELADILEVVSAIIEFNNWSSEDVEKLRLKKASEIGSFSKKIILENADEDY
jgi:predicted house-cleaning noncanonical NTP pyrophosphatase (MazG superfamily)